MSIFYREIDQKIMKSQYIHNYLMRQMKQINLEEVFLLHKNYAQFCVFPSSKWNQRTYKTDQKNNHKKNTER